ncbi:hypothetical protein CVU75_03390 [Candidatus Dependentiae bacterium HGW-Dependentiae-1]|nr:MAG: hypothetical protein CVU75_03390 [Candidatus Dependentiae bacterium HGW-Dependentiae-1]
MLKKLLLATISCIFIGTLFMINSGSFKNQYLYATALLKYRSPGTLLAADKTGKPLILRWHLYQPAAQQQLFDAMRATLAPIAAQTLLPIENTFARTTLAPEHATLEQKNNHTDENNSAHMRTVAHKSHPAANPDEPWQPDEHCLIITAHEHSQMPPLGYIQYIFRNTTPIGTITLDELAIIPSAQRRGIGKLLVSSLYTIIPQIERIELYVRPTNTTAQAAYLSYGFTSGQIEDTNCAKNWCFFVYESVKTHSLQDRARYLKKSA